jgi:hypothetical protein
MGVPDGAGSQEEGRLAIVAACAGAPTTADTVAGRTGFPVESTRQRLARMASSAEPMVEVVSAGPDRYQATESGLDRMMASPVVLTRGLSLVLVRDPVPVGVRRELAARCYYQPPLWLVRLRGPFRWAIAFRTADEAEQLEEALNERSLETLACLVFAVGDRRVRPPGYPETADN